MNAFPSAQYTTGISPTGHSAGMDLRDYFAAKAMEALIIGSAHAGNVSYDETILSRSAYKMADRMMEGRK